MISNIKIMKKGILIIFIIIGFSNIYAHKNVTISQSFGNVRVIFTTGYYYEEINKALIIGQYAENLSKKMNFNNQITLFFKHNISHHREVYYKLRNNVEEEDNTDEIFLDMKDNEFSIFQILKLIEYAIINIDKLDNLDGITLLKKDENKYSKILKDVLEKKIYRPIIVKELNIPNNGISYFYKEDRFHVFRIENKSEKILLNLKNIHQIAEVDEYSFLIFNSKKSFYYITSNRLKKPSQRIYIDNVYKQIIPYKVYKLSNYIISITFPEFRSTKSERIMLFDHNKKLLIQDISELY